MFRIWPDDVTRTAFLVILICSFTASAAELSTSASIGVRHTDNAALSAADEINESILTSSVGAAIGAGSGPVRVNASTSFTREHYIHETFADQDSFNLSMVAGWEMLRGRVDWKLEDYFTQQSINSLNPDTPDNTQDTNVLTFGPDINFPVSARHLITLRPEYRKFTYEAQNIDNQQSSLNTSWSYQMFRKMNIGLSAGISEVDYDDSLINGNRFRNISLVASGQRSRSDYSFSLGTTRVDTENVGSQRGLSGSLTWSLSLTDSSSLRTNFSSDLTDSNSELLSSSRIPENGDFSNEQITAEVSRTSVMRVTYNKSNVRLSSSVWAELLKQDYELAPIDREVEDYGMTFGYPLTGALSSGISMRYNRIEIIDTNQKDNEYDVGIDFNYQLSRKFSAVLEFEFREKSSSVENADFDEFSVFANLVYSAGAR